ncbi:MAG: ShlB/FhaC/HecB family hemolysin secretion/activation protein [Pseudomonadota bacterium]
MARWALTPNLVWWCCTCLLWGAYAHAQDSRGDLTSASKPRFDLWELRVSGNSLLGIQEVERTLYRFLGAGKSVDDVEAAREALTQAYSEAGYGTVLVNIPEQDVANGIVYLQVVEGRVEQSIVSGAKYHSPQRIREQVPALADNGVLHLPSLQTQLAALNAVSGDRAVTPVLRPGRTPGTVEVELKVQDALPLHGSLALNDRYSLNTSRLRLEAQLSYGNLWQREHSVSLQYQTAPEELSEVQVWAGTYVWRDFTKRSILALYGVHSESEVAAVGSFQVLGQGDIVGARLITPFAAQAGFSHSLTLGMDYKDFAEDLALTGNSVPVTTPISYIPFSVAYGGAKVGAAIDTRFELGAHFGVRGVGDDEIDCEFQRGDGSIGRQRINEFACKRAGAKPNFVYLTASVEHTRELMKSIAMHVALRGQLADSPLISNEQFSAGGMDSVRGYLESERQGDDAIQFNFELRSSPRTMSILNSLAELRAHGFIDAAWLNIREPLPGQARDYSLAGAGLGLRAGTFKGVGAAMDLAWALEDGSDTQKGDLRWHFSLDYKF